GLRYGRCGRAGRAYVFSAAVPAAGRILGNAAMQKSRHRGRDAPAAGAPVAPAAPVLPLSSFLPMVEMTSRPSRKTVPLAGSGIQGMRGRGLFKAGIGALHNEKRLRKPAAKV